MALTPEEKELRCRVARWVVAHYDHSPAVNASEFCEQLGIKNSTLSEYRTAKSTGNYTEVYAGLTTLQRLYEKLDADLNRVVGREPYEDEGDTEEIRIRLERIWNKHRRKTAAGEDAPARRRRRAAAST